MGSLLLFFSIIMTWCLSGMADPAALPQAVSAFQACHFIGMPECEVGSADPSVMVWAFKSNIIIIFYLCDSPLLFQQVILAQCAVYLARAPKSADIYMAYANVKASLRTHKGPLPSVPLHLRNAPTKLMKQLGYAEGYKYNPAFSNPVEQEYLPEELRGTNFFTWKPSDKWLTATLTDAAKFIQYFNAMM